jgi:prephenate dehydratase
MKEIDKDNLEEKIKILDEDIQKVNELLVKLEKDKSNAIATMNALQGAKSQCVTLIKELHNDEDQSNGSSDDS